jgi:SpoVK/Ycf46/Vps4 family AAA+-type ATPase
LLPKPQGSVRRLDVAHSDLIRRLFAAHSRGDDASFQTAARELIAEERRRDHRRLAADLEQALFADRKPGADIPLTLRPIPKSRDDRPLVRLTKPERELDELVLHPGTRDAIEGIVRENVSRSTLTSHGLRPRQRLLFIGPPGTGKSAAAHAVAAGLSLPVATVSLASLTSSFLGDTARNIEAVVRFSEQTPCVLLFDEFDVLGQERGQVGDHGEMRRVAATVLQLLEEARGESVIVATSNHPQLVDVAIWRRFDELIAFDQLVDEQLAELITLKLRALPAAISTAKWARALSGFSPAEVELACFDAMRQAVLANHAEIDDAVMETAVKHLRERRAAAGRAASTVSRTSENG